MQVHKDTPIHFETVIGCVVELPDGSSALAVRRMDSCSETSEGPGLSSFAKLSDTLEASSEEASTRIFAPQGASHGSLNESTAAWDNPVYDEPSIQTLENAHPSEAVSSDSIAQIIRGRAIR